MTFVATVVTLFGITIAVPVFGQMVLLTSDLNAAGRNFSCTGETVTYTCSGQGNILFVNSPPLFNHAFFSNDLAPGVAPIALDAVVLTLQTGANNYSANLQIKVSNATQHMRINVSCSTNVADSISNLPLIHESQIVPPSTVTSDGLTGGLNTRLVRVSWTPPVDPQFDTNFYLVRVNVSGTLYTTRTSRDNSLDIEVPSGEITADVRIVTTCGSISAARQSDGSVSGQYAALYAAFLVPTFIGVFLIVAVVILAIFLVRSRMTISKFQKAPMDNKMTTESLMPMTSTEVKDHSKVYHGVSYIYHGLHADLKPLCPPQTILCSTFTALHINVLPTSATNPRDLTPCTLAARGIASLFPNFPETPYLLQKCVELIMLSMCIII